MSISAKKTKVKSAPKSPVELELEQQTLESAKLLVESLEKAEPFLKRNFEAIKPVFDEIARRQEAQGKVFDFETMQREAKRFAQQQEKFEKVKDRAIDVQREIVASDGRASPQQLETIKRAVEVAGQAGRSDIVDVGSDIQQMVSQAIGGEFDDRRNLVAKEQDRQLAQLGRRLDSNTAAAKLQFPVKANQARAQQVSGLLGLAQNAIAFNQAVRQQDLSNELAFADLASQGAQGLIGLASSNLTGTANAVSTVRGPRQAQTTTSTTPGLGLLGLGALRGVGGAVSDSILLGSLPGAIRGGRTIGSGTEADPFRLG